MSILNDSTTHNAAVIGTKTIIVHKADAEGALILDALTGMVSQPINERPEWSEGLAVGLLAERIGWYNQRLGAYFTPSMKNPDALAYEDLGWIGVDAEGSPVELEADTEFRMAQLAEHLGVNRTADLSHGQHDDVTGEMAHVLLDMDTHAELSAEEAKAFDNAQEQGFSAATKTVNER